MPNKPDNDVENRTTDNQHLGKRKPKHEGNIQSGCLDRDERVLIKRIHRGSKQRSVSSLRDEPIQDRPTGFALATVDLALFVATLSRDAERSGSSCIEALERRLEDGLRFMETETGFLGWVHPAARSDDIVALLEGCLPVILRPSLTKHEGKTTYTLIGDAYVQGVMHGECWP